MSALAAIEFFCAQSLEEGSLGVLLSASRSASRSASWSVRAVWPSPWVQSRFISLGQLWLLHVGGCRYRAPNRDNRRLGEPEQRWAASTCRPCRPWAVTRFVACASSSSPKQESFNKNSLGRWMKMDTHTHTQTHRASDGKGKRHEQR